MKLSITTKITIWYTIFLTIITSAFFAVIVHNVNERAGEQAKTRLMEAVADASENIAAIGKKFIIDDDLKFYDDGVYISVYDEEQRLMEGRRPAELSSLPELDDKAIKSVMGDDGETWYVYDSLFHINDDPLWVRGIVKDFARNSTFYFIFRLAGITFPLFVVFAMLGGFFIAKRGFSPVRDIIATAEEISHDGDLTKRIEINSGSDEIHDLAVTFNNMFGKLEKSFQDEKQFTANVSHELRTPLSVIISQSDYAMSDESYREKALEVINREAKLMSGLVNKLLMLSRSDSGRLVLAKEELDMSGICESIAEQQEYAAEENGMKLITNIAPDVKIYGDEGMIMRIIINLVENAIKYGRSEDSTVKPEIRLSLKKEGDFVYCVVEDNGPGIADSDMERIWERFYRVSSSRSIEGSGLGLSMVKALVKAHNGSVTVERTESGGSRFTVMLPAGGAPEQMNTIQENANEK